MKNDFAFGMAAQCFITSLLVSIGLIRPEKIIVNQLFTGVLLLFWATYTSKLYR